MNQLVVCGLNYHNTPLAIRERFIIPQTCLHYALTALSKLPHIKEAVLVSTCNRTEIYAIVSDIQGGWREIDYFFAETQAIAGHDPLKPNFRLLGEDVALHLFRVAAGLDSMILGENQILGQLKSAHQTALEMKTAGSILDRLFTIALSCGKRVRTETAMGKRAVSVSSAAVELAQKQLGDLANCKILIIGAGKMAQVCAKILLGQRDNEPIFMINRSQERVDNFLKNDLINKHLLETRFDFKSCHDIAAGMDLIIVSTSAPSYLLKRDQLATVRDQDFARSNKACIIDISAPRNVDPAIASIPGISLHTLDDLLEVVSVNQAERAKLTGEAEAIVFETLDDFHNWQRSLLVVPTISELRQKIESIRLEQMAKGNGSNGTTNGAEQHRQLEDVSRAIINQILHYPTTQLKATRDYEILRQQADVLRTLFNLDPIAVNDMVHTADKRLLAHSK